MQDITELQLQKELPYIGAGSYGILEQKSKFIVNYLNEIKLNEIIKAIQDYSLIKKDFTYPGRDIEKDFIYALLHIISIISNQDIDDPFDINMPYFICKLIDNYYCLKTRVFPQEIHIGLEYIKNECKNLSLYKYYFKYLNNIFKDAKDFKKIKSRDYCSYLILLKFDGLLNFNDINSDRSYDNSISEFRQFIMKSWD